MGDRGSEGGTNGDGGLRGAGNSNFTITIIAISILSLSTSVVNYNFVITVSWVGWVILYTRTKESLHLQTVPWHS